MVGGELAGLDVPTTVERLFGAWQALPAVAGGDAINDTPAIRGMIDRVSYLLKLEG